MTSIMATATNVSFSYIMGSVHSCALWGGQQPDDERLGYRYGSPDAIGFDAVLDDFSRTLHGEHTCVARWSVHSLAVASVLLVLSVSLARKGRRMRWFALLASDVCVHLMVDTCNFGCGASPAYWIASQQHGSCELGRLCPEWRAFVGSLKTAMTCVRLCTLAVPFAPLWPLVFQTNRTVARPTRPTVAVPVTPTAAPTAPAAPIADARVAKPRALDRVGAKAEGHVNMFNGETTVHGDWHAYAYNNSTFHGMQPLSTETIRSKQNKWKGGV
jgi:hypothetical protein